MSTTRSNKINYPYSLSALASKKLEVLKADHEVSWAELSSSYYDAQDLEHEVTHQLCWKVAKYLVEKVPINVLDQHEFRRYSAEVVAVSRHHMLEVLYEAYRLGFSDAANHSIQPIKVSDGP